jgi:hypothetical protein
MDRARVAFATTPAADRAIVAATAAVTPAAVADTPAAKPAGPEDAAKAADAAGPAAEAQGEGAGAGADPAKEGGGATGGLRVEGTAVTVAYMSEGAAAASGARVLRWIPARLCEALYGPGYRLLVRRSPAYDHAAPTCRERLPLAYPAHPPLRGLMARGDRLRPAPGDPPNDETAESGAAARPAAAVRMLEAPRTTAAAVRGPPCPLHGCRGPPPRREPEGGRGPPMPRPRHVADAAAVVGVVSEGSFCGHGLAAGMAGPTIRAPRRVLVGVGVVCGAGSAPTRWLRFGVGGARRWAALQPDARSTRGRLGGESRQKAAQAAGRAWHPVRARPGVPSPGYHARGGGRGGGLLLPG